MTTKTQLSPRLLGVIKSTLDDLLVDVRSMTKIRCRYLDRNEVRCTAEALDPAGELVICQHHAGLLLEMINHHWQRRTS